MRDYHWELLRATMDGLESACYYWAINTQEYKVPSVKVIGCFIDMLIMVWIPTVKGEYTSVLYWNLLVGFHLKMKYLLRNHDVFIASW